MQWINGKFLKSTQPEHIICSCQPLYPARMLVGNVCRGWSALIVTFVPSLGLDLIDHCLRPRGNQEEQHL